MSEYIEQSSWVKWIKHYYPHLTIYHIPNGEHRNIKTAVKLKNMGVRAGVWDLYCMDYKLYIEFKKNNKEVLSKDQIEFKKIALKTGHQVMLVYGFDDGVKKFKKFVGEFER